MKIQRKQKKLKRNLRHNNYALCRPYLDPESENPIEKKTAEENVEI